MDVFTPMWVYILECADGSYYTGVTHNLHARVHAHMHHCGAEYTKKHGPVKLVYFEEHPSHAPARKREEEIKLLTHDQKREIVESMHDEVEKFILRQ